MMNEGTYQEQTGLADAVEPRTGGTRLAPPASWPGPSAAPRWGGGPLELLFTALAEARRHFDTVNRTREVTVRPEGKPSYTFAYAPLDEIMRAVVPALADNGLVLTQLIERTDRGYLLVTVLGHWSGAFLRSELPITVGGDRWSIQKMGAELTYTRRYEAAAILFVTAEEDDDGRAEGTQGVKERPPIRKPRATGSAPPADGDAPPPPAPGAPPPPRCAECDDTGAVTLPEGGLAACPQGCKPRTAAVKAQLDGYVLIRSHRVVNGPTKEGASKPSWIRTYFTFSDGTTAATFDTKLAAEWVALEQKKARVRPTIEDTGRGLKVSSLVEVAQ